MIPTIAEAAARIAKKEISPVELVRDALARIDKAEKHINAFITLTADAALAEAKRAEADIMAGKLKACRPPATRRPASATSPPRTRSRPPSCAPPAAC